jgi:sterol 3beta-glucosyltransferase
MKITILTYGSRGDVQPFLPLSVRLMEKGYSVRLAAPSRFEGLVQEHKIEFSPLAGNPEELSRHMNDAGHNFVRLLGELNNHAIEIGAEVWRQTVESCEDADLIIHTFAHAVGAHTVARERNIPDIHIQGFPMFTPTGDYPNVTLPDLRSRALNRLTHTLSAKIAAWTAQIGFGQVRRRAGLPKLKLYWPFDDDPDRPRTPILCAWSPCLIPPSNDWPSNVHVTGYYFFPQNTSYLPQRQLESFLRMGKPPICVSFGSMINRDAEHIDGIVRQALKQTGNRGIILSGWSGVKRSSSDELLYMAAVAHDWLLPRCRMVIHHGGAGTTAAGLRAGIPNIVVPFMADQPFWGRRVHAAGAGPRPIPVKSLSAENLSQAITESENRAIRRRARSLGQEIRSEDGVTRTVEFIENYSYTFHRLY